MSGINDGLACMSGINGGNAFTLGINGGRAQMSGIVCLHMYIEDQWWSQMDVRDQR